MCSQNVTHMNAQGAAANNSYSCEMDYLDKITASYRNVRVNFNNLKVMFLLNF